ncbi:MAG: nuclear transport factor 2 family protein [Granulosicoccus sp.]
MSQDKEIKFYDLRGPEVIAQAWLDASALTATNKDFEAHFNLISKKARITGVSGYESISYDDWARQSEQEFKNNVLEKVTYDGLKMSANNDTKIMFKTMESVFANDGTQKVHGVEIVLEKEEDGIWRVIQERVMTHAECQHVGLIV